MKFAIFDDYAFQISTVRGLLSKAGYTEEIWPTDNKTVGKWEEAFEALVELESLGWNPHKDCIVLLLDLALEKDNDFKPGLEEIAKYANSALEPYVRIAYTGWAADAREREDTPFDNVIGKTQILSAEDAPGALRAGIEKAIRNWEARTNRLGPRDASLRYRLHDSVGAREAEAALGRENLSAIVGEVIDKDSKDVSATVLTGGYSGAFILRIEGYVNGGRRSIVCKLSKNKRILEDELTAWRRALQAYSDFVGLFPPVDTHLRQSVNAPGIWFIVQSNVPGVTLLDDMQRSGQEVASTGKIELSLSRLEEYTIASATRSICLRSPFPSLRIHPIDVHRFESSLSDIIHLRDQCVRRGYLNDSHWHSEEAAMKFLCDVVQSWDNAIIDAELSEVPVCEQHGDLNPRNLIVTPNNNLQLIDWARFGLWPIGYDLTRLELQTLARCTGNADMSDAFADELKGWCEIWEWLENGCTGWTTAKSPLLFFLHKIRAVQENLYDACSASTTRQVYTRVLNLNRTFDAIKMCSYKDLSDIKKLWCFLLALQCAAAAGLPGRR